MLETEKMESNVTESEFIERVEKAAKKGAMAGSRSKGIISILLLVALFLIAAALISRAIKPHGLFEQETSVEGHDMTIENHGFLGYTVADFAEAMLGDAKQLKKLEVYTIEVSDAATITNAGFAKLKVFSKCQIITYNGSATYTVDLSKLTADNIVLDEENKTVTLYIPHASREKINIPSDQIEFGDTEKGLLAIGSIKLTPEQTAQVETEARKKMETKLVDENVSETADRFAKLSVWEMYQPLVMTVSPEYKLVVDFK